MVMVLNPWFEAQAAGDSDYLVCGAENARAAGKAAGLESEPCATATYPIHGHDESSGHKETGAAG